MKSAETLYSDMEIVEEADSTLRLRQEEGQKYTPFRVLGGTFCEMGREVLVSLSRLFDVKNIAADPNYYFQRLSKEDRSRCAKAWCMVVVGVLCPALMEVPFISADLVKSKRVGYFFESWENFQRIGPLVQTFNSYSDPFKSLLLQAGLAFERCFESLQNRS